MTVGLSRTRSDGFTRAARLAVLGLVAPFAAASAGPLPTAADPSCAADFDSLVAIARRDYAGYQTAVRVRSDALSAMTDTSRAAAIDAPANAPACEAVLARWLAFFRDGHLHLSPMAPTQAMSNAPAAAPANSGPTRPDPARPTFAALDSVTFLLRIPTFDLRYKPAIDSLLDASRERLAHAALLVVDVRGNGGGGDDAFGSLTPFLAAGPIRITGADVWSSPGNTAYFREILAIPELPDDTKALVRRLVAEMEREPNHFIPIDRDTVLRFPTAAAPRTVAVLYDRSSGSTTEEFLLQARQSKKTILFSHARSAGALDYANVRQVALPSGRWALRFGTSRSRRLPANPVDPEGIAPTVRIPVDVMDEVAFVRGYLAGRSGA